MWGGRRRCARRERGHGVRSKCLWESVGLGVESDVEETEVNGLNRERVRCMYSTCVRFGVTGFSSKLASVFTHTHTHICPATLS